MGRGSREEKAWLLQQVGGVGGMGLGGKIREKTGGMSEARRGQHPDWGAYSRCYSLGENRQTSSCVLKTCQLKNW